MLEVDNIDKASKQKKTTLPCILLLSFSNLTLNLCRFYSIVFNLPYLLYIANYLFLVKPFSHFNINVSMNNTHNNFYFQQSGQIK